ncbi:MAG TPA: hypothetical protein VGP93_20865, partial [Polyangiaceae bacterium]|nr:hypothetical protein [Polyangiaceae bacterium]
ANMKPFRNRANLAIACLFSCACGTSAGGRDGSGAGQGGTAQAGAASGGTNSGGTNSGGTNSGAGAGSGGQVETGGGAGSGGSAGSAGAPVIANCDGLGAVGVWENVSPPEFSNPSNLETWAVAVNPLDGAVFASAGNITSGCGGSGQPPCVATGVFKSTDCGASWAKISTGRGASSLETGDPWALKIDPVNPDNMFIDNGYGSPPTLFKSTNGGVDWDPLSPDASNVLGGNNNFVQAVAMDPADPEHLVVTFHENCSAPFNPNCLSETTDGGTSWREFSGPDELTGWAEASNVSILGTTDFLLGTPAGWGGFFSSDSGATWTKVMTGPLYGSYGSSARIAPDGTAYIGMANTGVFFSQAGSDKPLGAEWTLLPGPQRQASVVMEDGVNLYVAWGWDANAKPFYSTPLEGLTTANPPVWTNMNSDVHGGPNMMEYDPNHHVLYAACPAQGDGVMRVVTP